MFYITYKSKYNSKSYRKSFDFDQLLWNIAGPAVCPVNRNLRLISIHERAQTIQLRVERLFFAFAAPFYDFLCRDCGVAVGACVFLSKPLIDAVFVEVMPAFGHKIGIQIKTYRANFFLKMFSEFVLDYHSIR